MDPSRAFPGGPIPQKTRARTSPFFPFLPKKKQMRQERNRLHPLPTYRSLFFPRPSRPAGETPAISSTILPGGSPTHPHGDSGERNGLERGNERKEMVEAAPGFEPGMKVLQTSALPLGYAAVVIPLLGPSGRKQRGPASISNLERETGVEPATPTLARWCSTTELFPHN